MNVERLNVKILKETIPALPHALGDIRTLRQVFVNLIHNGMDAAEGRTKATIWIRTNANENEVIVEIEDNGTGIPESMIDKIFEPFFTTKEAKGGTGLGLSLCYDFLKDMGGALKIESKPGYGTTVFVTLPRPGEGSRRSGQQ
jgi:signal transduction histidine kinase